MTAAPMTAPTQRGRLGRGVASVVSHDTSMASPALQGPSLSCPQRGPNALAPALPVPSAWLSCKLPRAPSHDAPGGTILLGAHLAGDSISVNTESSPGQGQPRPSAAPRAPEQPPCIKALSSPLDTLCSCPECPHPRAPAGSARGSWALTCSRQPKAEASCVSLKAAPWSGVSARGPSLRDHSCGAKDSASHLWVHH